MTARNHHYLPEFYLRGFTCHSKVHVFDLKTKKHFCTNPRNVGARRDFNKISVPGFAADHIETSLGSDFEGPAANAFKSIIESNRLSRTDFNYVMSLIALLAVRSPEKREQFRKMQEHIAEGIMETMYSTEENYKAMNSNLAENKFSFQDMKEFYESKAYKIDVPVEKHLEVEVEGMDSILPYLYGREWSMYIANKDTGYFVSTDRPVILNWIPPDGEDFTKTYPPGFALKNTRVFFPLSKTHAVVGEFDGSRAIRAATKEAVASINTILIKKKYRQIYASSLDFPYYGENQSIKTGHGIYDALMELDV